MIDALFETNNLKKILQICNDIYTKEGVEYLVNIFSGTSPTLREVSDAVIDYCDAWRSSLNDNVYLLSAPNKKKYAGQATDLEKRFKKYRSNQGSNQHFTRALKCYGFEKFTIEYYAIPTACADIIEKFMILWYDLMNTSKGYNKQSGGKNGWMLSDDIRAKMSAATSASWSQERRTKMSESRLGTKHSKETIARMRASWTKERRDKLSESRLGIPRTGATRSKISASLTGEKNPRKGEKLSSEHRAKISASMRGKKLSDDHCAKLSARKLDDKNYNEQPVVVNEQLYSTAKEASEKIGKNKKYVTSYIRRHRDSVEIFKVSKEFYKYCKDNEIISINRDMVEEFEKI